MPGARSTAAFDRSAISSFSSSSSTSALLLPANRLGRSNGMPLSSLLVYVPCRSGSPQEVFAGTYVLTACRGEAVEGRGGAVCAESVAASTTAPQQPRAKFVGIIKQISLFARAPILHDTAPCARQSDSRVSCVCSH